MKRFVLAALLTACGPVAFRIDVGGGSFETGCAFGEPGAYAQACFSWSTSGGMSAAIAAGATSSVDVSALVPIGRVASSDPAVAWFHQTATGADVDALRPGSADLIVYDDRGRELDRTTVIVAPTVRLDADVYGGARWVQLVAGTRAWFHVSTIGPRGPTVGVGAVAFSATGAAMLAPLDFFPDGDERAFSGSAGHGAVIARADSALAGLEVDFVDPNDVVALDASVERAWSGAIVHVVARTAAGPVYGAACSWATSSRALWVDGQDVAGIDDAPGSDTRFSASAPGRYTATCSVGRVARTVTLSL